MNAMGYKTQVLGELFPQEQREVLEQMVVDLEHDNYESSIVDEARCIVAGDSDAAPTVEHLRIVLDWLDGCLPVDSSDEAPF